MISGRYFIGLMSGTSLDAMDAVLVRISEQNFDLIDCIASPLDQNLRSRIQALFEPGENEIDRLGELDREIAEISAGCVQQLLARNALAPEQISAIGSHGQTLRHRPQKRYPFTLQIGDPNSIAALTDIPTVADFRRKDMALGGQGAPLAPAFHAYMCRAQAKPCAVLNIGGIANLSLVDPNDPGKLFGFDTGPGNGLMDAWIHSHLGQNYDEHGTWASAGNADQALLKALLADAYFSKAAPKSTGKEHFNLSWLEKTLTQPAYINLQPVDVQATLLELTVQSIADALIRSTESAPVTNIFVCGGGAENTFLMSRLRETLMNISVQSTGALGIAPMWVEAAAFAWLAQQTLDRLPGNKPKVTGARRDAVLGGIYYP